MSCVMADKNFERKVFISHAADDPHWSPEAIEAVASAIRDAGVDVTLDLWHQQAVKRHLSPSEWQSWMDDAIRDASHILCLVSSRYQQLWLRRIEDIVGFGVAFQSIRMIQRLRLDRQSSHERILTLRPHGQGYHCIPLDLALYFSAYVWPTDRAILLSHVSAAAIPSSTQVSDGLILSGLQYTESTDLQSSLAGDLTSGMAVESDDVASLGGLASVSDIGEMSVVSEVNGTLESGAPPSSIEVRQGKNAADQRRHISWSLIGTSGLWPAEEEWRAPCGDFPPPWASAWGDDVYGMWADLTVNGVTQRMRWIEPSGPEGFWMGSSQTERAMILEKNFRDWVDQSEHESMRVEVRHGFWLADTPCTNALWHAVRRKYPSRFVARPDAPEYPVDSVSWVEVMGEFIHSFVQTPEWGVGDRMCLPTELEWEYACRAGTRTAYWWGDNWDEARGNVDVTGRRRLEGNEGTTPVKHYAPNPWGLYDMHGNVLEWCSNLWQRLPSELELGADEVVHAVRGGSWFNPPYHARSASRWWHRGFPFRFLGFRFVLRSSESKTA